MIISFDLPSLLLQGSRALVFLMAWLAFASGFKYQRPWRISIFTVILMCYAYLMSMPLGGPGGNPHSNPPSAVNIILNIAFGVLFWRYSGHSEAQD